MFVIAVGCALIAFVDIALGLAIAHLLGRAWYGGPDLWVYAAGPLLTLLPLTALNDALRAVCLDGAGLLEIRAPLAILATSAALFFALALRIFRWE